MKKTNLFLLLTFTLSWTLALLIYIYDIQIKSISGTILLVLYMFIPATSVFIISKFIHKEKVVQTLKISFNINIWFLVAWLIMPLYALMSFGISLLFPDVSFSPDMTGLFDKLDSLLSPEQMSGMKEELDALPIHPFWLSLIQGMTAGITINAIAAFGEELGWRGFLLREYSHMKFLKASLLIGIIWGIWHAPIILMGHNYPEHPVIGVAMMTIWCILLSPVFTYILIKSKSVIAASVLHGTLNGTAGLAILLISGGNDITSGVTGTAGFVALTVIISGLFIYDKFISKENIFLKNINETIDYK